MKNMWMLIFMGLPLLTLAYIGWHFWCLLPLSALWRALIICVMVGCFLLTFANFSRSTDGMPMPLAVTCYEVFPCARPWTVGTPYPAYLII